MSTQKILVIDDDEDILNFVSYNLRSSGYEGITANGGVKGLEAALKYRPDLILLDLMMPDMDGIEVCTELRKHNSKYNPLIIFLTARAEDYSQVAALEAGADDYVVKPIRPRLLITKIESVLRRAVQHQDAELITDVGPFIVDRGSHQIIKNNLTIEMPRKEFDLLNLLISKPGYVFSREQIMSSVWGNETVVGDRTIDVHIRKLREKLGDDIIKTIKGVGYKFVG